MRANSHNLPLSSDLAPFSFTPATQLPCPMDKDWLLASVSSRAMRVAEQSRAFVLATSGGAPCDSDCEMTSGLTAFGSLLWVMRWILNFALGGKAHKIEAYAASHSNVQNRQRRKLETYAEAHTSFPIARRCSGLFLLLMRRISLRQRQELEVRLSLRGRIAIYGMSFVGSVLRRRARLTCYDHGWWRMPQTSTVNGGLWDVQLPPN